jgi:flagellar motor protein MotB
VFEREWDGEVEPFEWDGTDSAGRTVPDGNYTYVLTSTDEAGNSTREELVVTVDTEPAGPPEIDLSLRPQPFSPDGDGRDDRLTIDIDLRSEREIVSWEVVIEDFEGETFKTWSGDGRPPQSLRWDGVSDEGELVETARDYPIRLTVIDGSGEETSAEDVIAVDILVMREGNRLRIRVSNILFAPNTPDLFLSDRQQLEENLSTLQRLAEVLNRYPEHDIIIEGHAAHIFLEDPARQQEQEQTLIPLSRARATEVMQALMILGVDGDRMTIEAYGGSRPVVPHSNRGEMWRNRRVEFLLQREGR